MTLLQHARAFVVWVVALTFPGAVLASTGGILAVVGDTPITVREISREVARAKAGLTQSGYLRNWDTATGKKLFDSVIKQKIEQELLNLAFQEREQLTVPEEMLQERLNQLIENNSGGNRERFLEQIYQAGLTLQEIREKLHKSIAAEIMINHHVDSRIRIRPADVQAYFDNHQSRFHEPRKIKVQGIFLAMTEKTSKEDLLQKARRIKAAHESGNNFAELAREYSDSDHSESAEKDGDWGWVTKEKTSQDIWKAVSQLEKGDISAPVVADDGIYLLRVDGVQEAENKKLTEDVRQKIEQTLREKRRAEARQAYIEELKSKFYVEVYYDESG